MKGSLDPLYFMPVVDAELHPIWVVHRLRKRWKNLKRTEAPQLQHVGHFVRVYTPCFWKFAWNFVRFMLFDLDVDFWDFCAAGVTFFFGIRARRVRWTFCTSCPSTCQQCWMLWMRSLIQVVSCPTPSTAGCRFQASSKLVGIPWSRITSQTLWRASFSVILNLD